MIIAERKIDYRRGENRPLWLTSKLLHLSFHNYYVIIVSEIGTQQLVGKNNPRDTLTRKGRETGNEDRVHAGDIGGKIGEPT